MKKVFLCVALLTVLVIGINAQDPPKTYEEKVKEFKEREKEIDKTEQAYKTAKFWEKVSQADDGVKRSDLPEYDAKKEREKLDKDRWDAAKEERQRRLNNSDE